MSIKNQEQRTVDLILRNIERHVVYGDLIITNSLDIQNTTLIVSGALIFTNDCTMIR